MARKDQLTAAIEVSNSSAGRTARPPPSTVITAPRAGLQPGYCPDAHDPYVSMAVTTLRVCFGSVNGACYTVAAIPDFRFGDCA
ncbi:hypothetical protein GCM10010324_45050 [Streptomyces hiroshimensis]|uniref:Uncharacterized protein n=1 Tax=Streptomyces hiroshimensis TaxID=66424 RepID=A0ABQ2YV59_9ACTN|nr:hypothetical protein GCM10010324_45050 [Streptomyces hiroshimensis]